MLATFSFRKRFSVRETVLAKTLREHPNLLIDEKEGENRGGPLGSSGNGMG